MHLRFAGVLCRTFFSYSESKIGTEQSNHKHTEFGLCLLKDHSSGRTENMCTTVCTSSMTNQLHIWYRCAIFIFITISIILGRRISVTAEPLRQFLVCMDTMPCDQCLFALPFALSIKWALPMHFIHNSVSILDVATIVGTLRMSAMSFSN